MNFLKKLLQGRKKDNKLPVLSENKISEIRDTLIKGTSTQLEHNYSNRLAWWKNLPDDWKRLFMMENQSDTEQKDIFIKPTEEFLDNIFNRTTFHTMWVPIKTLSPLYALSKLERLILEFLEMPDFKEISSLNKIKEINADSSEIVSLEGLENYDNLEKLTLSNTDITTLIPIASLNNIKVLDIRGTLIHPQEVDFFQKLHPSTEIDFITPFNPLRRNKESLENPLLDYYNNIYKAYKNKKNDFECYEEGINHLKKNQFSSAIKKFDEAININPNDYRFYLERGFAKYNNGDKNGAELDFNLGIEKSGNLKDEAFCFRGVLKFELNDINGSLNDLYNALEISPQKEEYYMAIKELYFKTKNFMGVIKILDKVIATFPDNPDYYYDRGITYYQINNFNEAKKNMDKVLGFNPNDSDALCWRGRAKHNIGERAAAYIDLRTSKELGNVMAEKLINENF